MTGLVFEIAGVISCVREIQAVSKCLADTCFPIHAHHHVMAKEECGFHWVIQAAWKEVGDKDLHIKASLNPGQLMVYSMEINNVG